MIPRGEERYWREAAQEAREAALETDIPEEGVPGPMPRDGALHKLLVGEAREMRRVCPNLWEVLDRMTRPRGHAAVLMSTSLPLSAEGHMAYAAGQDSVGLWLRTLADSEDTEEGDDGEA